MGFAESSVSLSTTRKVFAKTYQDVPINLLDQGDLLGVGLGVCSKLVDLRVLVGLVDVAKRAGGQNALHLADVRLALL